MTNLPDLTALVLTLRPPEPMTTPGHLGRAAHALLLQWVNAADPALVEALHASDQPRPFTCSTLVGGRRSGPNARQITPGESYWVRFTGLTAEISAVLAGVEADPPAELELDHLPFRVESATLQGTEHEWAGASSYEELSAPHLLAETGPAHRWRISFASPTTFRRGKHNLPVPLPRLFFGGLARRWNTFSPVAISQEVERYAEEMVVLSRYKLRTRMVPMRAGALQVGCVGQADYSAMNRDPYWLALVSLLSDFCFYSGAGYQTAVGLGQVRREAVGKHAGGDR